MRHSIFFVVVTALLYSGCGAKLPSVKPFKMEVQQGNVVTSKMLLQLRPGMTRSQVRYIMGTPLIVDSFRDNRWDYFYELRKQGALIEKRRVILDFDKDALVSVRGDVVPEDKTAKADAPVVNETAKPEETQSASWTDRLQFWKKDKPAADTAPAQPNAPVPAKAAEPVVALAAAETANTPAKAEAAPTATAENSQAESNQANEKSATDTQANPAPETSTATAEPALAALATDNTPPVEAETHAVTKPGEAPVPAQQSSGSSNTATTVTPVFVDEAATSAEAKAAASNAAPAPSNSASVANEALPPLSSEPVPAAVVAEPKSETVAATMPPSTEPPAEPLLPPLSADNVTNATSTTAAADNAKPVVEASRPQVAPAEVAAKAEPLPAIEPVKEEPLPPLNDTIAESVPAPAAIKAEPEAASSPSPAAAVAAVAAVATASAANVPGSNESVTPTPEPAPAAVTTTLAEPKIEATAQSVAKPEAAVVTTVAPAAVTEVKSMPAVVATPAEDPVLTDAAVQSAVERWASAWRNKQLKAYLAAYATDFVPEGLPNKKAWEAQRKLRLSDKQGDITLELRNVVVERQGNQATARFEQRYAAKAFHDALQKTLQLRFDPKQKAWLITRESTAALPVLAAAASKTTEATGSAVPSAAATASASSTSASGLESDAAVNAAVQAWAQAWRSKSLSSYFAAYAADFVPEGLPNKQAWEAQRKLRLSPKQGAITLELGAVNVQRNGTQATATFNQKYSAKAYRDEMVKRLTLRWDASQQTWLIVREATANDANVTPPKRSVTAPEGTAEHLDGTLEQIGF